MVCREQTQTPTSTPERPKYVLVDGEGKPVKFHPVPGVPKMYNIFVPVTKQIIRKEERSTSQEGLQKKDS